MQKKVLIAAGNKPVDDHRLYEKWALFYNDKMNSIVGVFGLNSNDQGLNTEITFFKNSGGIAIARRVFRSISFIKCLFAFRPDIVHLVGFEFVFIAKCYKVIGRKKILFYDVIENERLNQTSQNRHNSIKKLLVLFWIKFNEDFLPNQVNHYFYSDIIYKDQLDFLNFENTTQVKNLYSYPKTISAKKKTASYLLTGTLSKIYGVELGFEWIKQLKSRDPNAIFTIYGYGPKKIETPFELASFCNIYISNNALSHEEILNQISSHEYLLLPYKWSESFEGCVPAKLYEALYLNTKVLVTYSSFLDKEVSNSSIQYVDQFLNPIEKKYERRESKLNNSFSDEYYNLLKLKLDQFFS